MKVADAIRDRFATWALRSRPPEPSPVTLGRRRIYVLPTRGGMAFGVALMLMLLGAINYNLSLGYALVFLLAGLGITTIFHSFRNLLGVSLVPGKAVPVFAGEIAHFALVLHNPDREPRRLVTLGLRGGTTETLDIPAAMSSEVRLGLPANRRGWLALPRITLETDYPLGLIRAWAYAAPEMHCLVYPEPATDAPPPPHSGGTAEGRLQRSPAGDDFSGLRSHQPSDPPRHVAWKAAARQDGSAPLLTKQFSGASADTLWLDWDDTDIGVATERRLSIMTRWVLDAAQSSASWGLKLPRETLPPATGDAHLRASLKALALHEAP
ncbi:hypothetical protein RHDC4_02336 [Rhodocyclaceae bacterium]|nr:hypothetical protein RHDC4_02336 [Rhodocyclaceae bacterium]